MRLTGFVIENFKKIRLVEVQIKSRVTTFSGRNGQGKTSALDGVWALFVGKPAIPEKPVRKGAKNSKLSAVIADDAGKPFLHVRRTISEDRTTSLTVEAAPGATRPAGTPQAVLDALIGEMSFDPIEFIHLKADKQVEFLRKLVKVDIDIPAMNLANSTDYDARTKVNGEVKTLRAQIAGMSYSPNLPEEKVDESAIEERIIVAGKANAEIFKTIETKGNLRREAEEAAMRVASAKNNRVETFDKAQALVPEISHREKAIDQARELFDVLVKKQITFNEINFTQGPALMHAMGAFIQTTKEFIARQEDQQSEARARLLFLEKAVTAHDELMPELEAEMQAAAKKADDAPEGTLADTNQLMEELEQARLVNREIDKRTKYKELEDSLRAKETEAARLTRVMDDRLEQKRIAVESAKIPVDGLTFGEGEVLYKGIPLQQMGEAEQIRVTCELAMASNPPLRCLPIQRGESLDDKALEQIEALAEKNDFQIFIARVETSGKVGIVLEDGMVLTVNE